MITKLQLHQLYRLSLFLDKKLCKKHKNIQMEEQLNNSLKGNVFQIVFQLLDLHQLATDIAMQPPTKE